MRTPPNTRMDISGLPFANLLGIEIVEAKPELVVARLTVRKELCTIPDILHGGAIMSFADTVGAVATVLNLPEGAATTTVESKTNSSRRCRSAMSRRPLASLSTGAGG